MNWQKSYNLSDLYNINYQIIVLNSISIHPFRRNGALLLGVLIVQAGRGGRRHRQRRVAMAVGRAGGARAFKAGGRLPLYAAGAAYHAGQSAAFAFHGRSRRVSKRHFRHCQPVYSVGREFL